MGSGQFLINQKKIVSFYLCFQALRDGSSAPCWGSTLTRAETGGQYSCDWAECFHHKLLLNFHHCVHHKLLIGRVISLLWGFPIKMIKPTNSEIVLRKNTKLAVYTCSVFEDYVPGKRYVWMWQRAVAVLEVSYQWRVQCWASKISKWMTTF